METTYKNGTTELVLEFENGNTTIKWNGQDMGTFDTILTKTVFSENNFAIGVRKHGNAYVIINGERVSNNYTDVKDIVFNESNGLLMFKTQSEFGKEFTNRSIGYKGTFQKTERQEVPESLFNTAEELLEAIEEHKETKNPFIENLKKLKKVIRSDLKQKFNEGDKKEPTNLEVENTLQDFLKNGLGISSELRNKLEKKAEKVMVRASVMAFIDASNDYYLEKNGPITTKYYNIALEPSTKNIVINECDEVDVIYLGELHCLTRKIAEDVIKNFPKEINIMFGI